MTRTCCTLVIALALMLVTTNERASGQQQPRAPGSSLRLHAGAVAALIQQIGGQRIQVVNATMIAVLNPQAVLVESGGALRPAWNRRRVLILFERGSLGVAPELAIGHTVHVFGTARTVLGMQVTREVAWPEELTRENIRHYDVGAVVLASSLQTADGIELIATGR